jgi:hypothetical protein
MSDNEETTHVHRKSVKAPKKGAQMKKTAKQPVAADSEPEVPTTKKSANIAASEQSKKRLADTGSNPPAPATPKSRIQAALNGAQKKSRNNEYIPQASNSANLLAPSPDDSKKKLQDLSFVNVFSDEAIKSWQLDIQPVTSQYMAHRVSVVSPTSKYITAMTPPLMVTWSMFDGLGTMAPKNSKLEKAQYSARIEEGCPPKAMEKDPKLKDRQSYYFDRQHAAIIRVLELMFDEQSIQPVFKAELWSKSADQVLEVEKAKGHKVKSEDIQEGGKLYEIVRKKALDAFIGGANVYFNAKPATDTTQAPGNKTKKPIIKIKTDDDDVPKGPRKCYFQHYVFSSPKALTTDDTDEGADTKNDKKMIIPKGKFGNANNNNKASPQRPLGTIDVTREQLKEASRRNPKQLHIWRQRMEQMGYTWNEFQILDGEQRPIYAKNKDWTQQRILGGALMNFMITIKIYDLNTAGNYGIHLDMNSKAWFVSQGTQSNTFEYHDETTAHEEYISVDEVLARLNSASNNNNTNFTFGTDEGRDKDEEMQEEDPQHDPDRNQDEEEAEQKDPNYEEGEEEREIPPNQMDVGGPAFEDPVSEEE